ncbi:MAG: nucleotidyl transferase AbiEii/AbiGii toxin family protein [Deltaproteobacteria bacterium]|nr:nucleotidyl transferase AbiEii/AbiGii toxin family protein [Deltaproteobacteria bacterium]
MEILTGLQREILNLFGGLPDKEAFYLTGGTALSAFYLKHRQSQDLDFFTDVEGLILPFSQKIESALGKKRLRVERRRGFSSFVEISASSARETTIILFSLDSPFRFEPAFFPAEFPGVKVDSLMDIAANKLLALFGRAALRDFIDVYFLVQDHFRKKDLVEKAMQKDPGFDLYWLGVALERLNDFAEDSADMHLLIRPCSLQDLKAFFGIWQREIMNDITKGK